MTNPFKIIKDTGVYVRAVNRNDYIVELPYVPVTKDVIADITFPISDRSIVDVCYKLVFEDRREYVQCTYLNPIQHPLHGLIRSWYCPVARLVNPGYHTKYRSP